MSVNANRPDDEACLTDFHQPEPETEPDPEPELEVKPDADGESEDEPRLTVPEWATNTDWQTTHSCQNCGGPVNAETVRVWGDNNGVLHHCPNCVTATAVKKGAGADPDFNFDRVEDGETEDNESEESIFGPADTSELPSYMKGGAD